MMKFFIYFVGIIFFIHGRLSYANEKLPLQSFQITCLTSKCHSSLNQSKFIHSPIKAKGCIVCHELVPAAEKSEKLKKDHPSVLLGMDKKTEVATCLKCHVEWGKKQVAFSFSHGAILKNGCVACHNPHGSNNPKLLKVKGINFDLCITCHKKNENWEKGEKESSHRALEVKENCLNCHEIHGGKFAKLLKEKPTSLCLSCHEETIAQKEKGSVHTPVKKGECLKCHTAHYGTLESLLEKKYDGTAYVKDTMTAYSLCLSCHQQNNPTGFRNGDKNLHLLHLSSKNKDDLQYGCAVCHEVHVGSQEMLIKKSFTYKKYSLPLAFEKTKTGGNCTTACHGLKAYDQNQAVINQEVHP